MKWKKQMRALTICVILLVGMNGVVSVTTDAITFFEEDFNSGIDSSKWISWGDPLPIIVPGEGIDGSDALDCNGDGSHSSGITSHQNLKLSDYPTIEFWAKGYQSLEWHQIIHVGISVYPSDYFGGSWDETGYRTSILYYYCT